MMREIQADIKRIDLSTARASDKLDRACADLQATGTKLDVLSGKVESLFTLKAAAIMTSVAVIALLGGLWWLGTMLADHYTLVPKDDQAAEKHQERLPPPLP